MPVNTYFVSYKMLQACLSKYCPYNWLTNMSGNNPFSPRIHTGT